MSGDLGRSLIDRSLRLAALRAARAAQAAVEEAAGIYRQLAREDPAEFLRSLAHALNNLAYTLSWLHRDAEASAIRDEVNPAVGALAGHKQSVLMMNQYVTSWSEVIDSHISNLTEMLLTDEQQVAALKRCCATKSASVAGRPRRLARRPTVKVQLTVGLTDPKAVDP
jgi:hypothetical protein